MSSPFITKSGHTGVIAKNYAGGRLLILDRDSRGKLAQENIKRLKEYGIMTKRGLINQNSLNLLADMYNIHGNNC